MRQIGYIEKESDARLFGDFLYVQGIENQIEPEADHGWAIWIHSEEELERAGRLLSEFRVQPEHPRFRAQAAAAAELRAQSEKEQAEYAKKIIKGRQLFPWLYAYGLGPLTLVLIIASVAVFIFSKFGGELRSIHKLFFSEHWRGLPEIFHGEVWRLFTPIFIHFDFVHLFFNLLWLRDLGSMIEARQGSRFFALLVLIIAVVSNLAQYLLGGVAIYNSDTARQLIGGPFFGGMSGVVYGLVGYVWMKGKYDPAAGLFLHPWTVIMVILWFFVCLTGYVGTIANAAHAAGLVLGVAWGYLSSSRRS